MLGVFYFVVKNNRSPIMFFALASGAMLMSFILQPNASFLALGCTASLAEGTFAGLSRKCA